MDKNMQKPKKSAKFRNMIDQFKPTVPRRWLLILAGLMWSGVGVLLLSFAVTWWVKDFSVASIVLGLFGISFSVLANRFQFSRLAVKNIHRINTLNDRTCVFSFQAWTGYLIIAIMMSAGILLRKSSIPKPYLAVLYATIGGALMQASLNYYRHFFRTVKSNGR